jgi:asparagine N-glycosylation enzyme membrane subunit Stt3
VHIVTLSQALETQPLWVQYWNYFMVFCIVLVPLSLLIWKQSRFTSVIVVAASLLAGVGVFRIFDALGYVKLLGLPHVIVWTPLVWFLFRQIKRNDMPVWPRRIMLLVLAVFLVSLSFDYVDVLRYVLGEKTATPPLS